ncbi:Uma2 family endonuclease [Parageobacillus thermoglucosidasius]|uniref:Uma2 family endonuclease n=1 Tax=Parageobacillus thermoglucosidasius TaxID=1426 RepID=UPI003B66E075
MKSHEAKKRYTYKDYIESDGRWELINGIPYNMTPAPSTEHQRIVGELYFAMRSFLSNGMCQSLYFSARYSPQRKRRR